MDLASVLQAPCHLQDDIHTPRDTIKLHKAFPSSSPLSVYEFLMEREVLAFWLKRHPFLPSFMPEVEFRLTFFELFLKILEV